MSGNSRGSEVAMVFGAKNNIGDALNLSLFPQILNRTKMWSDRGNKVVLKDSKTPKIGGSVISDKKKSQSRGDLAGY